MGESFEVTWGGYSFRMPPYPRNCSTCGKAFTGYRATSQYCSMTCRIKGQHERAAKTYCYCCGSTETAIHPKGYPNWYYNGNTGLALCAVCYKNSIRYFRLNKQGHKQNRQCYFCGSKKSQIMPKGYQLWYFHGHQKQYSVCASCHAKYMIDKIRFLGKRVFIHKRLRTGVCTDCKRSVARKEIRFTTFHHTEYDQNNPFAHTVELCPSCHTKEGWALGQYSDRERRLGRRIIPIFSNRCFFFNQH